MSQPHLIQLFLNIYKSHKYLLRVCSERVYRLARHMRWNAGCEKEYSWNYVTII